MPIELTVILQTWIPNLPMPPAAPYADSTNDPPPSGVESPARLTLPDNASDFTQSFTNLDGRRVPAAPQSSTALLPFGEGNDRIFLVDMKSPNTIGKRLKARGEILDELGRHEDPDKGKAGSPRDEKLKRYIRTVEEGAKAIREDAAKFKADMEAAERALRSGATTAIDLTASATPILNDLTLQRTFREIRRVV